MKNNNQGAIQHSLLVQVQITILCIDILNVRAHFECLIMAGSDFGEINFGKTKSVEICAGEGIVPYLVSRGMIYENVKYRFHQIVQHQNPKFLPIQNPTPCPHAV